MAHALGNPHLTTKSHRHPSFQLRSKCGVLPMFISATSCKYLLRRISENKHTHTHSTYTLYIYIYLYIIHISTTQTHPLLSWIILDHGSQCCHLIGWGVEPSIVSFQTCTPRTWSAGPDPPSPGRVVCLATKKRPPLVVAGGVTLPGNQ